MRVSGSVRISEWSQGPGEVNSQSPVSSHTHSLFTICCSQEATATWNPSGAPEGPPGNGIAGKLQHLNRCTQAGASEGDVQTVGF